MIIKTFSFRYTLYAVIAAIFLMSSPQRLFAQASYTSTWVGSVEFSGENNQIVAAADITVDYSTQSYYCITAEAYLYRNGAFFDYGQASNLSGVTPCDAGNNMVHAELLNPDDGLNVEYVVDGDYSLTPYYTSLPDADYYNYQAYADSTYGVYPASFGFYGSGPPRPDFGTILLGTVYNAFQRGVPPGNCFDDRDAIRREYVTHQVNLQPTCNDFTNNAHTVNFTFNQLNGGNYVWAILRNSLLTGVENVRTQNGNTPLTINSGYRNPARNAIIPGAARQSRHQYGDAADFNSNIQTFNVLRQRQEIT